MINRQIGRVYVKPSKANIKKLLQQAKLKNIELNNSLRNHINRDIAVQTTISQQTDRIENINIDIENIRNGRIEGAELVALRNQIKSVLDEGLRNNTFPNVTGLANLQIPDLNSFMELLKFRRQGLGNLTDQIPSFNYKAGMKAQDELCSVCHDEYKEGQECCELQCKHLFHRQCIITWLERKSECPMCKKKVTVQEKILNDEGDRSEHFNLYIRERRL